MLLVWLCCAPRALSQTPSRYYYDDGNELVTAIDASGNQIVYVYDPAGNILSVTRGTSASSSALAILSFTPQTGGVGATVTIEGQNFSTTAASNTVTFNGVAATVVSATAT
jgi:YD repeat-containing protein